MHYDNLDYFSERSSAVGGNDVTLDLYHKHLSFIITDLTIEEGETFLIHWVDHDASKGKDDGLAVDDFSITPRGIDRAPLITAISPADGTSYVAIDANISVTFSEPVDTASDWFSIDCSASGPHTARDSGGALTFIVDPDQSFEYSETCTFSITGSQISDQDASDPPDEMENNMTIQFTTTARPDAAPTVAGTSPSDHDSVVALDSPIVILFSEAVETAPGWFELTCEKSESHSAVVSGGPLEFTITPDVNFTHNEICTLTVFGSSISDRDLLDPDDLMEGNHTVQFSTVLEPDAAPTVTSISPANNETAVALDSNISIQFSEPVETAPGWFDVVCSKSAIHSVEVTGGPAEYHLVPDNPFFYDETCTVTIDAQKITDADDLDPADGMAANFSSIFFTLPSPDEAPYLSSTSPANNNAEVGIDQDLIISFSEEVELVPGWFALNCSISNSHTAQVNESLTTFTISPENDFAYDETCSLKIFGDHVQDKDINDPPDFMITDQTINFTTTHSPDAAPFISNATPLSGADSVPINSNLTLEFNEAVSTSGEWLDLRCSLSGDHSAQISAMPEGFLIDPDTDFAYNETCTYRVAASLVGDLDSIDPPDQMETDYEVSFTTVAPPDLPPVVVSTSPENNTINAPISGYISLVFSEAVTPLPGWIKLQCTKSGNHIVFLSGGAVEYSFGSDRSFEYSEKCTVTIDGLQISDLDAIDPPDKMESNYSFSFTTIDDPDLPAYPIVLAGERTHPADGEILNAGIQYLTVQYSKDVLHDGSEDAADNPQNYRLISAGLDNSIGTTDCEEVKGDDVQILINQIQYDPLTFTATISINMGASLPNGKYRLIVCGAHTIRDLAGNPINNGANTLINFSISITSSPGGSGGSGTGAGGGGADTADSSSTASTKTKTGKTKNGLLIPVTGFAPGRVTLLPMPGVAYSEQVDLRLEIPTMRVDIPITGVPQEDGLWDVTWLSNQAGWLEGSAFPTSAGNSVLTGHVWDASNQPGAFYGLGKNAIR